MVRQKGGLYDTYSRAKGQVFGIIGPLRQFEEATIGKSHYPEPRLTQQSTKGLRKPGCDSPHTFGMTYSHFEGAKRLRNPIKPSYILNNSQQRFTKIWMRFLGAIALSEWPTVISKKQSDWEIPSNRAASYSTIHKALRKPGYDSPHTFGMTHCHFEGATIGKS